MHVQVQLKVSEDRYPDECCPCPGSRALKHLAEDGPSMTQWSGWQHQGRYDHESGLQQHSVSFSMWCVPNWGLDSMACLIAALKWVGLDGHQARHG